LLSAERSESKNQQPFGVLVGAHKLKAFPLPSSQRQRKNIIISAIFATQAKRAVYYLLTYTHSIAWIIPLQAGRFKGLIKKIH